MASKKAETMVTDDCLVETMDFLMVDYSAVLMVVK